MLGEDKSVARIKLPGWSQDDILDLRFIHSFTYSAIWTDASDICSTLLDAMRGTEMKIQSLLSKILNDSRGSGYNLSEITDKWMNKQRAGRTPKKVGINYN